MVATTPHFQFENFEADYSEEEHPDDGGVPEKEEEADSISDDQWDQFWFVVLACASRVKSMELSKKMENKKLFDETEFALLYLQVRYI